MADENRTSAEQAEQQAWQQPQAQAQQPYDGTNAYGQASGSPQSPYAQQDSYQQQAYQQDAYQQQPYQQQPYTQDQYQQQPYTQQQDQYQQQYQQPYQQPYGQQPYQQPYGQQPYQQYQPPYQPYQAQVRVKDHVIAGLLALFFGIFGIHKFYLGYTTQGFIMIAISILGGIFSLGIAALVVWVIGVIEGVIYLVKPQPEFERIYVYGRKEWF